MTATDPRRNSLLGAALRGRARSAAALTGVAATLLTGGLVVGIATSQDATATGTGTGTGGSSTTSGTTGTTGTTQTGTQDGTSSSSSSSSSTADNTGSGQLGSVDQNQDAQGGSNGS